MGDFSQRIVKEMVPLRRYALSLAQNRDDAEDLVQDCIARALQRAHRFQPGTNLRAWLMTILHNQFISGKRRGHRVTIGLPPIWEEHMVATPPSQLLGLELRAVSEAFARLPREQKRTMLLVCLHGMTYQEAAERLGVPEGTVRSRLSRARAALSAVLEAEPNAEEERARAKAARTRPPLNVPKGRPKPVSSPGPQEPDADVESLILEALTAAEDWRRRARLVAKIARSGLSLSEIGLRIGIAGSRPYRENIVCGLACVGRLPRDILEDDGIRFSVAQKIERAYREGQWTDDMLREAFARLCAHMRGRSYAAPHFLRDLLEKLNAKARARQAA